MAQARARRARRGPNLGTRLAVRVRASGATALASALFIIECSLYSALTPLLPRYAATYHLSKVAAGALAASYSAGFLAGAPLAAWMAVRGIRRTALTGLALFAAAAVLFGLVHGAVLLGLTRVVQGVAGSIIWGGGLVWLITTTAPSRRGAALGVAFGASTAGTLLGPLLGTIALSAGGGPVFGAVGACALVLTLAVSRLPAPASAPLGRIRPAAGLRQPALAVAAGLTVLVSVTLGTIGVLVPLRLAALGSSGLAVGFTFLLAATVAAGAAPLAGRTSDRRGPLAPVRASLAVLCASLVGLAFAGSAPVVSLFTIVGVAAAAGGCIAPSVALAAEAADRAAVSLIAVTATLNIAFAAGELMGATAGPALAQAAGELPTTMALGVAAALIAVALSARHHAS